ncbi:MULTISPECIES: hypothetical protein [Klebsiella pneumoniae complex]|uniref:hypothetical protein n=1 Tax=Klebsiella pneumoniae complex TaxID=3390273 RepID=UPI002948E167|nr:hypothetical protein [Klebsiella quasipneumoniae]MDV5430786.1 hypothetical protein [Klebsiella quasipneumoniae]MDV5431822.1 hypothetical protein [Klebsiella quasipneumoniae]
MLQSKIREAFADSVSVNPKGYRYLHTRDFVRTLQEYFVDKTTDESENRLWMLRNMGRVL